MGEKIESKDELCRALKINDCCEIEKSEALQSMVADRALDLAPHLIKELVSTIPEIATAINRSIDSLCGVAVASENSEQARWHVVRDLLNNEKGSSEDRLKGVRILQKIRVKESSEKTKRIQMVASVAGIVAVVAIVVGAGVFVLSKDKG